MKEVTYQALVYNNHTVNQFQTFTIPIKKFAGLKVMVTGNNTNTLTNQVTFNNNITLQPYICTLLQTASNPWVLEFNNNAGEIDRTQMVLRVPVGVTVTLIFKFYNN